MSWTWLPADVGLDPADYTSGQTPVKDDGTGLFVPGTGGGGIYLSVMDYGATADGTTDDHAAINAAINAAAAAGGGTVFVPAGSYYINGTIVLKSDVVLMGEGRGSLLTFGANPSFTAPTVYREGVTTATRAAILGQQDRLRVHHLRLEGPASGQTHTNKIAGLLFDNCNDIEVVDVHVHNVNPTGDNASGVFTSRCKRGVIRGGTWSRNGYENISIRDYSDGWLVTGVTSLGGWRGSIQAARSRNVRIDGNIVLMEPWTTGLDQAAAILVHADPPSGGGTAYAENVAVTNNLVYAKDCYEAAILIVRGGDDIRVEGNLIETSGSDGIMVGKHDAAEFGGGAVRVSNVTVANNSVDTDSAVGSVGIIARFVDDLLIHGNSVAAETAVRFEDETWDGLATYDPPSGVRLFGNDFSRTTTATSGPVSGLFQHNNLGTTVDDYLDADPAGFTAGTDTIADTTSSQNVTHGLGVIPRTVLLTPRANDTLWVSARDVTTFTAQRAGTAGALGFDWLATGEDTSAITDPSDIADLLGWYAADDLTLSNADPVSTWANKVTSGGAPDLTQGTAANQPTYRTSIVNSLPAVRFDGTDDHMAFITPTGLKANDPKTILAVWVGNSAGSYHFTVATRVNLGGVNNDARGYFWLVRNTTDRWLYSHAGVGTAAGNPTITNSTPYLTSMRTGTNGGSLSGRLDKVAVSLSGSPGTAVTELTNGRTVVGRQSTAYGGFDLAELLMYGRRLTDTEVEQAEDWLAAKYAL
jgi:hypothetical protein